MSWENMTTLTDLKTMVDRVVARSENPDGHIALGGDNVPPLVDIGLTILSKSGRGARAPPAPPPCNRPVRKELILEFVLIPIFLIDSK